MQNKYLSTFSLSIKNSVLCGDDMKLSFLFMRLIRVDEYTYFTCNCHGIAYNTFLFLTNQKSFPLQNYLNSFLFETYFEQYLFLLNVLDIVSFDTANLDQFYHEFGIIVTMLKKFF